MKKQPPKTAPNIPKVIILAAGVGSRIRPLTNDCPKSLLKVAGTPILERMITNCQACGLTEFVIVLGYLENKIRAFVQNRFPQLNVTFIVNDQYETTNTGYSLMLAINANSGAGFIKFDADVVFDQKVLQRLMAHNAENTLCIDRIIKLEAEEVKVVFDMDQRVQQASKTVDLKSAMGESIGIEKISAQTSMLLVAELETMMREEAHRQDYYEAAYERLIAHGVAFHITDITDLDWVEIDTHDDFEAANSMFGKSAKRAMRPPSYLHLSDAGSIQSFRRK
ncbi:phosphocholine cytidylyltransferase family protein [Halocynthiibacter styelae]|uniref:Phosphocholine cytidylyltransferase family protein n=1 Tax=Halocynthiibacter styelae TaxID=2761955 RepID=A0A8J7LX85_9RHOB|nr:phosphocholine cytidylyltransferase family protein [Paenihalocynthiibacter styelae]MBI1495457.1 phosphocholine cytidylyltransferase family protein [Paenihalocynthiibacter styelae]